MKTTIIGYGTLMAIIFAIFLGVGFVSAQEEITLGDEGAAQVVLEEVTFDEVVLSGEVPTLYIETEETEEIDNSLVYDEEVFSEEEAIDILENSAEISEAEMDTLVIVGDVVVMNDEFVVLELDNGSYIKVPASKSKSGQRRRTGSFITLNNAQPGQTLTIAPQSTTSVSGQNALYNPTNQMVSLMSKGTTSSHQIKPTTLVVTNGEAGQVADLEAITDDSLVTIMTDENGEVVAITILDDIQNGGKKTWIAILAVIIVLSGLIMWTQKGKKNA